MAGASFEIRSGLTEIGSAPGAGIQLSLDGVSPRHARVDGDGGRIVISDLGSPDGTWVNGRRLTSGHVLRDGDQVRIGRATLRFRQAEEPEPGRWQGDGRDAHGDDFRITAAPDPWEEMFEGRGAGRGIAVLGACVSLMGFALFTSAVFGGFSGDLSPDPFERELMDGIPSAPAGFALFLGGGLLAALGLSVAKTTRKRTGTRRRRRRQKGAT